MNALEFLKQDHQEALGMMDQLEMSDQETASAQSQMAIFNQLKQALTLHTKMEEQLLYPALQNNEQTGDMISEAYEEHQTVDEILSEMSGMAPSNEEFSDKLAELRENVEHHVEEEENEMFPKAEQILGQHRLEEMGNQMQQMKQGISATATKRK
ncbi:MAG TPA: hemerythrin domain-containing protein [Blastocatellia bacterium]|jgi:hemerythrin-like domain-containing protein|nr:hemerythrin domain-containing protein [Blastocatellia bacterium]